MLQNQLKKYVEMILINKGFIKNVHKIQPLKRRTKCIPFKFYLPPLFPPTQIAVPAELCERAGAADYQDL